ncbi:hypothetical protein GCM10027443_34130 [Pontibacter brevis]
MAASAFPLLGQAQRAPQMKPSLLPPAQVLRQVAFARLPAVLLLALGAVVSVPLPVQGLL